MDTLRRQRAILVERCQVILYNMYAQAVQSPRRACLLANCWHISICYNPTFCLCAIKIQNPAHAFGCEELFTVRYRPTTLHPEPLETFLVPNEIFAARLPSWESHYSLWVEALTFLIRILDFNLTSMARTGGSVLFFRFGCEWHLETCRRENESCRCVVALDNPLSFVNQIEDEEWAHTPHTPSGSPPSPHRHDADEDVDSELIQIDDEENDDGEGFYEPHTPSGSPPSPHRHDADEHADAELIQINDEEWTHRDE